MTQVLVPKSPYVWKKFGGWGYGSEQAPLNCKPTMHYKIIISGAFSAPNLYKSYEFNSSDSDINYNTMRWHVTNTLFGA